MTDSKQRRALRRKVQPLFEAMAVALEEVALWVERGEATATELRECAATLRSAPEDLNTIGKKT